MPLGLAGQSDKITAWTFSVNSMVCVCTDAVDGHVKSRAGGCLKCNPSKTSGDSSVMESPDAVINDACTPSSTITFSLTAWSVQLCCENVCLSTFVSYSVPSVNRSTRNYTDAVKDVFGFLLCEGM